MINDYIFIVITVSALLGGGYLYWQSKLGERRLVAREEGMNRRMYELAILKELGDRVGYSLDVQQIIDIITGSLHQFMEYSAVSYMLLEPEKVIFKVHLERSVHRKFLDDVRGRMLGSLSALLGKEYKKNQVSEVLSGAVLVEELEEPVRSFFNIPLIIGEKVVGVLTVAHTEAGLYKEEEMTILYKIIEQASQAVTRLQEVVATEQQKLNSMVESMSEGVVMTDKEYHIVVANPAARSLANIDNKEEISIFNFIDSLGGAFDIRGKLEESVKLNKEIEVPEATIGERFFQIFVSPVKSNFGITKGEILGGVVIFHDITHEKELELMRKDFTSMMVHELRSPLDGIRRISDIMKTKSRIRKKDQAEYVDLIFKNSSGMLDLVNDLLDVAKIESGKFEVRKESANIADIVNDRINFYATSAKDANVSMNIQKDSNLPQNVMLDPIRITQVLNNLLSNSLKFTPDGGVINIQLLVHKNGERVYEESKKEGIKWNIDKETTKLSDLESAIIVAVTDTGAGVASNDIPNLFNKFKQFKATAKSGNAGTGLGLAIVKGIVEAHGGIVGVESEDGAGSTFYFTIPIDNQRI